MRHPLKSLVLTCLTALGLAASAVPAFAQSECAPYLTSGRYDQPVMGELLGTKLVRVNIGGSAYGFSGSVSESVYYGYYKFTGSAVWSEWWNCATYQKMTLLP